MMFIFVYHRDGLIAQHARLSLLVYTYVASVVCVNERKKKARARNVGLNIPLLGVCPMVDFDPLEQKLDRLTLPILPG